jgi:DNA topoisomerase-2
LTRGVYKVLDSKTVQITELPIGEWTSNFKTMLDELMGMISVNKDDAKAAPKASSKSSPKNTKSLASNLTGSKRGKSANSSASSSGLDEEVDLDAEKVLIKDYKDLCSESTVKFVITFEPRILSHLINNSDKNGISLLEKKLHLTSKLSFNSKLNFFGPDGKLLNLTSIDQIMDHYFDERLNLYVKRKAFMEGDMKRRLVILSAKAKFILDIIEKRITVNNKPKAEIIEQLRKLKYPVMIDKELVDLDTLAKGPDGMREEGDYNYLISMPIYSLTKEKKEELVRERDELDKELAVLLARTPGDLWKSDLDEFEVEYAKFMKSYYKDQGLNPLEFKAAMASAGGSKLNLSSLFSPTR